MTNEDDLMPDDPVTMKFHVKSADGSEHVEEFNTTWRHAQAFAAGDPGAAFNVPPIADVHGPDVMGRPAVSYDLPAFEPDEDDDVC